MLKRYFFSIYFVLLSGLVWSDEFSTIQENIKPGNIVIIGETHQKPESAQLFALLVDSAVGAGRKLTNRTG